MALSLRDSVHGFIRADPLEAALVGSSPVQRLRSIRQLGLTYLVYPGAEHSRFCHALGAMELAGRVYDALAAKSDGLLVPAPESPARRAVRAAALLHDVGHAPFSHSAEELFEEGIHHEEMTRRLLSHPEVEAAFQEHGRGLGPEAVLRLLTGGGNATEGLLAQIISGELDADKMDYLLRDSLHCGVRYGSYDLERLLDTIAPLEDPRDGHWGIGVEEGGVHALEALVMARYYMFTQVYFNVTGKALELHLNEWLREQGVRWPREPKAFLERDDLTVLTAMRRSESAHARAVLARGYYPLAYETREHLTRQEQEGFEALVGELVEELGPGNVLLSHSAKDSHRMGESRVLVRGRDGRLEPMEQASHFIRHLAPINRYRIYAPAPIRKRVAAAIRDRWR